MGPDPKILRWIAASVNKYFDDNKSPYALYFEGQTFITESLSDWAELSISSLRKLEFPSVGLRFEVDIHIMCSSKISSNLYDHQTFAGFFLNLMQPISVLRLGDDSSKVGCLILRKDTPNDTDIIPWGKVQLSDGPANILQTSVYGFYQLDL